MPSTPCSCLRNKKIQLHISPPYKNCRLNEAAVLFYELKLDSLKLDNGEAGLPKPSVVLITRLFTVDKRQLGEYLGTLSGKQVRQILEGIRLLTEPRQV
jgi:hypothetical protein